jgi:hypothetical protein
LLACQTNMTFCQQTVSSRLGQSNPPTFLVV